MRTGAGVAVTGGKLQCAAARQAKVVEEQCGFSPGRILYFANTRAAGRGIVVLCSVLCGLVYYFEGNSGIWLMILIALGIVSGAFLWVAGRAEVIALIDGNLVWNIHTWFGEAVRVPIDDLQVYRIIECNESWRAEIRSSAGWHLLGTLEYEEHCRICRALQELNPRLNWEKQREVLPTLGELFLGRPRKK